MKCHPVNGFINHRCELNVTSYTNHYSCLNITNTLQISLSDSPLLPDFKLLRLPLFCFLPRWRPAPLRCHSITHSYNDPHDSCAPRLHSRGLPHRHHPLHHLLHHHSRHRPHRPGRSCRSRAVEPSPYRRPTLLCVCCCRSLGSIDSLFAGWGFITCR